MKTDPVQLWHRARLRPLALWRYRPWHDGHLQALRRGGRYEAGPDALHLRAAADWLARAQDASDDGGITGRYLLRKGWTSSYPETTGYIVPTLLALGEQLGAAWTLRAERCIGFLLTTQLEDGAFPAGEIAANRTRPSPFNTGQILNGLLAWHCHSRDETVLEAAVRAGRWLVSVQDADGAWRKWFYHDVAGCYAAHLACFLADLAVYCDDADMLAATARHLDWVLGHRDAASGWIDNTGFTEGEQQLRVADLHTIAYMLTGVLKIGEHLGREDALAAVRHAAVGIGQTLDRLQWLPGVLDHQWRSKADSACLTGNAQMALVWMRLFELDGDARWLDWAVRALELVKATQVMDSTNPGLLGGVPGTDPMWGWYNDGAVLSWSAKFFIDALLRKQSYQAAA